MKIHQTYTNNGVDQFFVMVQPWLQPVRAWNWLFDQGLSRDRGWTLFLRGTEPATEVSTRLRIKAIGPEYAKDFARIVAGGSS